MFDFQNLFVFDLANNHQGDLLHGKNIISELATISKAKDIKSAIKLQFRDLDTFIHENELENKENPNIKRFLGTKLEWEDFNILKNHADENNLYTMCTPFDENSVKKIIEMKFDLIKVASCSAKDWPYLKKFQNQECQ